MMLAARLLLVLAALAASAAVAARPAAAAAPACPASDLAPSAIVIEVSTGTVACERDADARRSIASTTKLMTALLTLERAKLSDTFTAARYFAAGPESKIGLDPGERMSVRDLLRGLLVESGNDAAVTLAEGVSGSRRAFVRAMNRRAAQLELRNTHYANPIGLDEVGNYSSARDLVRLAIALRTNPFFRTTVDRPTVTLTSGNRDAHVQQPQHARRPVPLDQRRQDRPHAPGRLRAGRLGARLARRPARLRRARHAEPGGARRGHPRAAAVRASSASSASPRSSATSS